MKYAFQVFLKTISFLVACKEMNLIFNPVKWNNLFEQYRLWKHFCKRAEVQMRNENPHLLD